MHKLIHTKLYSVYKNSLTNPTLKALSCSHRKFLKHGTSGVSLPQHIVFISQISTNILYSVCRIGKQCIKACYVEIRGSQGRRYPNSSQPKTKSSGTLQFPTACSHGNQFLLFDSISPQSLPLFPLFLSARPPLPAHRPLCLLFSSRSSERYRPIGTGGIRLNIQGATEVVNASARTGLARARRNVRRTWKIDAAGERIRQTFHGTSPRKTLFDDT